MSVVTEQAYRAICQYCTRCINKNCLEGLPWYAVSIHCKYFIDGESVAKKARQSSMKRLMKRVLVETV